MTKICNNINNWQGDLTCCFFHKNETINHSFFECCLACHEKEQPDNMEHMFSDWLHGLDVELTPLFMLNVASICWSL
jgi:hypothetical protein